MFWHPLHATSAVTCLLAMAVGCFANAFKNGTYHCVLTGPLFLIAAILLLSSDFTRIKPALIWTGVLVGTGIAFLLEWRYSRQLSGAAPSMRRPIRVKSFFTLSKRFFFFRSAKPPCRHPSIRTRR